MSITPNDLQALTPDAFESLVAHLLEANGCRNVIKVGGTGDEGIDIRAEWLQQLPTGDSRLTVWAVQCKRYSESLFPQQVQAILNIALEPPLDLLPARPDFFLIATSSGLTTNARRIVERANNERSKYGCTFVVWDGDLISKKVGDHQQILARFFKPTGPAFVPTDDAPVIRLTILLDKVADTTVLTFLCDSERIGPVSQMAKSHLSEDQFNQLVTKAQQLTSAALHSALGEPAAEKIKQVGQEIFNVVPPPIRDTLLGHGNVYVRLASNTHLIPFELAYDSTTSSFLGASVRIGRIQVSDTAYIRTQWPQPSILLIGPSDSLPGAHREIRELTKLLTDDGIAVTALVGDSATGETVRKLLADTTYQIIHYSGHGIAEPDGKNGVVLADGTVPLDQLLSRAAEGSLVFLSACSSGALLNELTRTLFHSGVNVLVGFVGPVTDMGAHLLAVRFYEGLSRGSTLGDAMHAARNYQRSVRPHDLSWASFVLFGDPTVQFTTRHERPNGA